MIDKLFSAFLLAIFTTSILVYAPYILPQLLLGAVIVFVVLYKVWGWLAKFSWRVYVTSIISAVFVAVSWYYFNIEATGVLNILYLILGFSWVYIAVYSLKLDINRAIGVKNE